MPAPALSLNDRLIHITPQFAIAPQLMAADMAAAKQHGFTTILNARPDGEEDEDEQPSSINIEKAAIDAGIAYSHIPIANGAEFSQAALQAACWTLTTNTGPILGFCLSGVRSLRLWALASALAGAAQPEMLIDAATSAGYSLEGFRDHLERLARGEPPLYVADTAAMMI